MTGYDFFDSIPQSIKPDMAKVFLLATEAFSKTLSNNPDPPAGVMDEHNRYDWKKSLPHSRCHAKKPPNQWRPAISAFRRKSSCSSAGNLIGALYIHNRH